MRDAHGKRTPAPAMDEKKDGAQENKPYIVGSGEVAEKARGRTYVRAGLRGAKGQGGFAFAHSVGLSPNGWRTKRSRAH
jgi:hypothetical protein